jgi:hypothetical protein
MVDRMATMGISPRSRQHEALVHMALLQPRMVTTAIHSSKVARCRHRNLLLPTTHESRSSLVAVQSPRSSSRLTSRGLNQPSAKAGLVGNSPRVINEIGESSIFPRHHIGRQKFGSLYLWVPGAAARSLRALAILHCARLARIPGSLHDSERPEALTS